MSMLSINASISSADMTDIESGITDIKAKLTFLINLVNKERQSLRKKGTKREGYVADVYQAVVTNSSVIPSSFSISDFTGNKTLDSDLLHIRDLLSTLIEGIDDTRLLVGSQLVKKSDSGYDYLKRASKDDAALQEIVERIGKAFLGQGRKKSPPVNPS